MTEWVFHDPYWLLLLLLLPLAILLRRRRGTAVWVVPEAEQWRGSARSDAPSWMVALVYVALFLLIIGMARPQQVVPQLDYRKKGYDLIIAIDLSTSMYAEDFQQGGQTVNRLQAINPIISAFINERPEDRIGIVTFAGRAYTFAPLTFDHAWLRKQAARLSIGLIEDGTAIGDAIGVSLKRLRQGLKTEGAGGIVVLLTDGASNKGALDPRQAASLAADEKVAVYTIGAGAEGDVPMPIYDYAGNRVGKEMRSSEIDTLLLKDIAEGTGGLFFRATDEGAVQQAFELISQDAKVEFDAPPPLINHEQFHVPVLAGLMLLGGAIVGILRRQIGEVVS